MADTYRVIPFDRSLEKQTQALRFPETHDQWVEWYNRRESAYLHDPYSLAESKAFRLFRAFDPNGDILSITRRITRDIQHVTDTGAGAIAGGTMLIEAATDDAAAVGDVGVSQVAAGRVGVDVQVTAGVPANLALVVTAVVVPVVVDVAGDSVRRVPPADPRSRGKTGARCWFQGLRWFREWPGSPRSECRSGSGPGHH